MFLCKSSRPMIDDSFSVSLSSSKRRLNLRQNSRILKMHSFVKLFSILSSRGTTQTPSVKKNFVVVVVFDYTRDERSFGATCNREESAFCDSLFFMGAFYPFFFLEKPLESEFEIFEEGATRREKKCGRYDANARRLLAFLKARC